MVNRVVKCCRCKKEIFYMSKEYIMEIPIICSSCYTGKKVKKTAASTYAKVKGGIRKDVSEDYYFRSSIEANFARILQYIDVIWFYENKIFQFGKFGYKTKPFVYIMDFEITDGTNEFPAGYYEIKGYMNGQSRNKLTRLKKRYPKDYEKTIIVLFNKYKKKDIEFCEKLGYRYMLFDELTERFESLIPTWE